MTHPEKYFNMIAYAIGDCFKTPKGDKKLEVIEINKEFATSKLLKMFCDCSYNFEYEKLSKLLLERNREMEERIKAEQEYIQKRNQLLAEGRYIEVEELDDNFNQ